MKAKASHYVRTLKIYNIEHRVKRLQHMSVAEFAIPFYWKGLPAPEILWLVDYMGLKNFLSAPLGFTNLNI